MQKNRIVWIKSLEQIKQHEDYDKYKSRFMYERDSDGDSTKKWVSFTFWSLARNKFVDIPKPIMEKYFGTGLSIRISYRDSYKGIDAYNIYFSTYEGIGYDYWFLNEWNFFQDDDFLL